MTSLEEVRRRAEADAESRGYKLNPDLSFLNDLLEGLKTNEERYGYPSCPCRYATGIFELDKDIICPCDYRDIDVEEFGACYCGLFVSKEVYEGKKKLQPVPERRPGKLIERALSGRITPEYPQEVKKEERITEVVGGMKLWYCKQCGYVVFREEPPYICPICKAKREFFAEIYLSVSAKG
ncbi:MAG: ferredoxin-thioredoxin reductase catalytic domain-containing protein [Candidatus Methanomethylicaceae archaeon]|nr:ferredoxin-thioredoxin reductase catalytic domain-containing protein [Candidatus Verstraetearchaeota archaeon]